MKCMARRPRFDETGCPQHVVIQALDKRPLFRSRRDKALFLRRTAFVVNAAECPVLAWALMDTHAHLCMTPTKDPIGKLMQRIVSPFARAFNARHLRAGPLVSGRFWSRPIGDEDDLLTVIGYVCLNPLRGGIVSCPSQLALYPWTSAREVLGSTRPRQISDVESVLRLMSPRPSDARAEFQRMLFSHAEIGADPTATRLSNRDASDLSERWTVALPETSPAVDRELRRREIQTSRRLWLMRQGWSLDRVIHRAAALSKTKPGRVRCGGRRLKEVRARRLVALFAHDVLGLNDCEIGRAMGVSRQSVCRARSVLLDAEDDVLDRWAEFFELSDSPSSGDPQIWSV